MIKSLRYRLLSWLLSFVILTFFLVIPANFVYQNKTRKINTITNTVNTLYNNFLKDSKVISDFLLIESFNPDFYITGQSKQLLDHYKINKNILSLSNKIKSDKISNNHFSSYLNQLSAYFYDFNVLFDSIVYLTYKRGYNNFGLAGEMNDYFAKLEESAGFLQKELNQLRKYEKDYFQWHNQFSLDNFNALAISFRNKIEKDKRFSTISRNKLIELFNNYFSAFERLLLLENKIGLTDNTNLTARLNQKSKEIEGLLANIVTQSAEIQQSFINKLNLLYLSYLVLIIILSVLAGYFISKRFVLHLEKLTDYISSLTKNKFVLQNVTIDLKNSAREIIQIYEEFHNMLSQLYKWEQQHKIALKNAEENKKRYQELADMLPQSVFETDIYGNYTYVNKAWFNNFRYTATDLRSGINISNTLVSQTDDSILGNVKLENSTFKAIRKDKSFFEASVYSDNIIKDGEIVGKRGIIIDVSDKMRYIRELKDLTSKAQISDKLKSSFLANMSHEIRTPMNSIIGFSNLLASEEVPDEQKKQFIHYIQSSSEILLNLVDDIIDIAKIEAGELKIVKKECNLTALLTELHNTFNEVKNRVNKQSINLILSMDEENPNLNFKTDPFRLRQILSNLIGNAIKFTEKGVVKFGYKVTSSEKIEFFVKDTGIGLTREELDLIFERFKRARHSEEKNITGTGLGLTISKNLVELLGGEMWVDSLPDKGTTFSFTLPYLKITKPIPEKITESYVPEYNWQDKTILIVEDDTNSMHFLVEILRKTNAKVVHVPSGDKAIEACLNNPLPDIIIMDIQLQGMDGLEATKQIKKINPAIPVIAQTAYAMAGDKDRITQAGCDDYIPKPIDYKILLPKINSYLKNSKFNIADIPFVNQNPDIISNPN
jgi:signal transduction histidine kinase/ActR/RegA family two-component response regulator